jgi:hypothetical protein
LDFQLFSGFIFLPKSPTILILLKQNGMKNWLQFYVFILVFGLGSTLNGQDLPFLLDFETAAGYTTSVIEFSDGGTDYFTRTDGGNIGGAVNIGNVQGNYFFGAQDTDGSDNTGPDVLTIDISDIDISGTSGNYLFSVFIAEDDDGSAQDWDGNTSLLIEYDIDDLGNWVSLLAVEGSTTGTNSAPAIDTDFDGVGDGAEITDDLVQFSIPFMGSGSFLDIRVTFSNLDAGDEDIAIDHIEIVDAAAICPISALTLESATCSSITAGPGDTYTIEVSYTGTSATAMVTNFSGSGSVLDGDLSAGNPIIIEDISEADDWILTVTGDNCDLSLEGTPPDCEPAPVLPNLRINEFDTDTPGTDMEEFIELKGDAGLPLDDFVVVFFNGGDDESYKAHGFLTGVTMPVDSFYVMCFGNNNASYCDTIISGSPQNGADGVGLYYEKSTTDFPNGTAVTSDGLIDGLVYDTDDADDEGLLAVLDTEGLGQIDEDENNMKDLESIQRGSWFVAAPTPGLPNDFILPVRFINFEVKNISTTHFLSWQTTEEKNHDHFEVEVSINGAEFKMLDKVSEGVRKGNLANYQYHYQTQAKGTFQYRIKQVDLDGRMSYSSIKTILVEGNRDQAIKVYPTFSNDFIYIESPDVEQQTSVECINVMGKVVVAREFAPGMDRITMDISQLLAGTYFIRIERGGYHQLTRIFKTEE